MKNVGIFTKNPCTFQSRSRIIMSIVSNKDSHLNTHKPLRKLRVNV